MNYLDIHLKEGQVYLFEERTYTKSNDSWSSRTIAIGCSWNNPNRHSLLPCVDILSPKDLNVTAYPPEKPVHFRVGNGVYTQVFFTSLPPGVPDREVTNLGKEFIERRVLSEEDQATIRTSIDNCFKEK